MRFFKEIHFFWLLVAVFWLLTGSCSQKKNTFTSRTFHNLAAHYNGLYWANVSLEEGIYNLDKAHIDDYSKILPVFRYADDKAAKANYPQFDRAIEKTNKVIQYHSMMIKGVEYCRWIDENYMTMGKAHFYKRDYYAAVTVFEYVVKVFPNNPVRNEAFLWLVRCYNQMNSVVKTGPILDLLKHDRTMKKSMIPHYQSVLSDYYLRAEQFKKAEEALLRAVLVEKKKTVRGRYLFILAQLYEEQGDLKKASEFYSRSARLHPSYEMEFNARLAKARTFQVGSSTDTREVKKELNKMLKDEKNLEYLDQIYYALGTISARENDERSALVYYKLSAQSTVTNIRQKSVSYLSIADIYFDRREYVPAQAYYDSAMAFLPNDFKDYNLIKNKKESLTLMIKDMTTIAREDSLLKVAQMDTASIGKMIDGIIAKLIQDEEKKKEEDAVKAQLSAISPNQEVPQFDSPGGAGLWYFYNSSNVFAGIKEFYKNWGSRPSEDNWRRSSKEVVMTELAIDTVKADTITKGTIADNHTRVYYAKNIPFTYEQKERSKAKIVDAYYSLGNIYKEDLQDNQRAVATFEELLKLYPSNKYVLNLYYQLYRLYLALNNAGRANYYKEKIMNEFSNSEYARIIANPDYQNVLAASRNEIENFYGKTYAAYREGKFGQVIAMVSKADSFYSSSELMPKFALLRAYSIGKTRGVEDYERALQSVVAKYPKDEAKARAEELLEFIKHSKEAPVDTTGPKESAYISPYTFKDSVEHQCIIVVSAKKFNVNEFKQRVADFNQEYFSLSSLDVSNVLLDPDRHLIRVKSFSTAAKAKDYYDLINQDGKVYGEMSPKDYQLFPISTDNFTILYKLKKLDEYNRFFTENYLGKK